MIVKGFITEVGQKRSWNDKDGVEHLNVILFLALPYVKKNGEEQKDELSCEMTLPNEGFLETLRSTCQNHEKCEFQLKFNLSDWNGKKIQNIKLNNLTKIMM